MLGVTGHVGHRDQFDPPFSRGAVVLALVTAPAGADYVAPAVATAAADRHHVVAGQAARRKRLAAVQAQVTVAREQRGIAQRRRVVALPAPVFDARVGQQNARDFDAGAFAAQRVDAAVSLPNTKLLLQLYDGDPQAGGQLIDVADDGRGAPFAGDSASKSAMVRIAFDQPGDQPESWATATEQSGWDAGASELGTPGSIPAYLLPDGSEAPEPVMGTNILPMSWASVKGHLYP